jgi:hypothetical protein
MAKIKPNGPLKGALSAGCASALKPLEETLISPEL